MPIIFVKKAFPFAVDGNQVIEILAGEQEVSDRCALVAVEHLGVASYPNQLDANGLKLDGPTIAEFVAAGYPAVNYPPEGYASRSSQAEIDAAIEAEKETDPLKMKVPDLKAWLTVKGIEFDPSANKDALQALVPKRD